LDGTAFARASRCEGYSSVSIVSDKQARMDNLKRALLISHRLNAGYFAETNAPLPRYDLHPAKEKPPPPPAAREVYLRSLSRLEGKKVGKGFPIPLVSRSGSAILRMTRERDEEEERAGGGGGGEGRGGEERAKVEDGQRELGSRGGEGTRRRNGNKVE
jgi:hypothetical protein